MFAPVGYTPLSMLWDQFLNAKLEDVYRSASEHYAASDFAPALVRGSPLDIAEHVFAGLMWKCWPHAFSADGQVIRIHSRFQDDVPGLFSKIAPHRSAYAAAATELESGNRVEIENIAGNLFEEWDFEPDDQDAWRETYPTISVTAEQKTGDHFESLRFHTLPVCFERSRFLIVRTLPSWARFVENNRDQELLVEHLGGHAICVPDTALTAWDKILSGEIIAFQGDMSWREKTESRGGRPAKVPKVAVAYRAAYPEGHFCSWKEAVAKISSDLGESISEQTLRRAIELIREQNQVSEQDPAGK